MGEPTNSTHTAPTGNLIPVRGALKVEVGTSSPVLEAGRPFSVLVTTMNPYDVSVEITSVATVVPVEFIDVKRREYERERDAAFRKARQLSRQVVAETEAGSMRAERSAAMKEVFLEVVRALPFGSLFNAAFKASQVIIASTVERPEIQIESTADIDKLRARLSKLSEDPGVNKPNETMIDMLKADIEAAEKSRFTSTVLNPGNSSVQIFTLKTTRSLFFPPSAYEIPIQVKYKIAGVENQDTIRYRLSIRAPLSAVITGSVIGSVAGFLLRDIFEEKVIVSILVGGAFSSMLVWLTALIGNIVLAIVTVVAFARKRDTQPFISVEDFWGGLFVGAVAGYTGKSMLHGMLGTEVGPGAQLTQPLPLGK